jgi:hypothetical protein
LNILRQTILQSKRILYDRPHGVMYDASKDDYKTELPYLYNALIERIELPQDVVMQPKYINFSIYDQNPSFANYQEKLNYKRVVFKQVKADWQLIEFDNLLNINDKNKPIFIQLFAQKLSALKDVDLDCSDPSKYIEIIRKNFYVLNEGVQFRLFSEPNDDLEYRPIYILFSWAELKPFLL